MNESKIVATKRLQSEGLWNEASLYREEVREHLRGEGMTRKEANKGAWEKMLEAYPPFDADDEAAHWLSACDFPPAEAITVEPGDRHWRISGMSCVFYLRIVPTRRRLRGYSWLPMRISRAVRHRCAPGCRC